MKILITGAFGNIGFPVLEEALERGHEVSVLELDTTRTRKRSRRFADRLVGLFFADIRDEGAVELALRGQEAVIHLSGIIPPLSENQPELCREVNAEGTRILSRLAAQSPLNPVFILASSIAVMGPTQGNVPPVRASDPVNPINHYGKSKVEAEKFLKASGVKSLAITRFGGVMPTRSRYKLNMLEAALSIPYDSRFEYVMDSDLAVALINGAERLFEGTIQSGKTYFIGGGEGCQVIYSEFLSTFFKVMGIPLPKKECFKETEGFVDWLDTEESEADLSYQRLTQEDFIRSYTKQMRFLLPLTKAFGPLITKNIERKARGLKAPAKGLKPRPSIQAT